MNEVPNDFVTSNDKVERIFEDNEGNIWFGGRTNEGVFRYDGKTFTHFSNAQKLTSVFQKQFAWKWRNLFFKRYLRVKKKIISK